MISLPPLTCSPRGHINVSHPGSRSHYTSLYLANGLMVLSTEIYYSHTTHDRRRGDQNTGRHGGHHAVPSPHDGSNTRGDVSTSNWYCHTILVFLRGFHLKLVCDPAGGRVHFTVPGLFETSVCMRGAEKDDGWFFVGVKFLISVGGDMSGADGMSRVTCIY